MQNAIKYPGIAIIYGSIFLLIGYSGLYNPTHFFSWSEYRSELRDSVLSFEYNGNIITGGVMGYSAKVPKNYKSQLWLEARATDGELISLFKNYPNGTVKGLAFRTLCERKNPVIGELFEFSLNDTSSFVDVRYGCVGQSYLLSEFCYYHSSYSLDDFTDSIFDNILLVDENKAKWERLMKKFISHQLSCIGA